MYEYCELRGIAHERVRQGDRGDRRAPSCRAWRSSSAGVGPTACQACAASTRRASRSSSPTLAGSPGCTRRRRASPTSRGRRAATRDDVLDAGGTVATGCEVEGIARGRDRCGSSHARGTTEAGHAVFCAGAWADRLAVAAGADPDPRIVPFRGAYLRLAPERRELVRSLIYPVPDPSLPFLGVHLTKHIDGEVLIGPTALMAGARDAYSLRTVRRRDVLDTLAWPGTWRMLARWWATGVTELRHAAVRSALRPRRRALRARAGSPATSSPRSPGCARRRSHATAASSTTSSSPGPSVPCTCATRPRPRPPPRWRSRATLPTRPSAPSTCAPEPARDAQARGLRRRAARPRRRRPRGRWGSAGSSRAPA